MFRFIRWALFLGLGYAVYEIFQAIPRQTQMQPGRRNADTMDRSTRPGVGTVTGPGQGERVRTENADGSASNHIVGRGVVM